MSSPNEPGYPRTGRRSGSANGSTRRRPARPARWADATDRRRRAAVAARPAARAPQNQPPRAAEPTGRSRSAAAPIRPRPGVGRPAEPLHLRRSSAAGGRGPSRHRRREPAPAARSEPVADRGVRQRAARPVRPDRRGRRSASRHRERTEPTGAATASPRPRPGASRAAHGPGAGQHADPPDRPVERAEGVAGAVGGAVLRLDDRRRRSSTWCSAAWACGASSTATSATC